MKHATGRTPRGALASARHYSADILRAHEHCDLLDDTRSFCEDGRLTDVPS